MGKRIAGVFIVLGIVGGAIGASKRSDADRLAQVGHVVAEKVKSSLPDASKVAGPLVAFKPGDALPVEEKVRTRIRTDKAMEGADVTVAAGTEPGEVRLRGVVQNRGQWSRAADLAKETVGVEKVVNELAVPE